MIYSSSEAFLDDPNKRITLMGMSNVGKTRLASRLPKSNWFHYSVDYRLATAHLREDIVDVLKMEMMKNRILATCLRQDAMQVDLNVTFSNLAIVSQYLGMLGARRYGGLPLDEFLERQSRHRSAEVAAIRDLAGFIGKARQIYGYPHFINDASGSLCELIDPNDDNDPVLRSVTDHSLLVYIMADAEHEARLVEDASKFPKPLYYRPQFLSKAVEEYLAESGITSVDDVDPALFVGWVFSRLLHARRPRYEAISKHGCVISRQEAAGVRNENDLIRLVGKAIDRRLSVAGDTAITLAKHAASSGA